MCSHTFSTQVNLKDGVPNDCVNTTCTAGAGTMVLEFGILSRLLGDPVYESYARRSVDRLWGYRSNVTGLLGTLGQLSKNNLHKIAIFFLAISLNICYGRSKETTH